ncbi:MAG: S8 family serine peptidase [Chloroflexota bacterium]
MKSIKSAVATAAAFLSLTPFALGSLPQTTLDRIRDDFEIQLPIGDGSQSSVYRVERPNEGEYIPGRIIVKYKENAQKIDIMGITQTIRGASGQFETLSERSLFPEYAHSEIDRAGLSRIVELEIKGDPYDFCEALMRTGKFEYATPELVRKPYSYTPDDPMYASQTWLKEIGLPEAWEITKGSPEVIIAIVDAGVDWQHPDLKDRIWTNEKETPGDGIDNDGNGYVDDVRGWDFVGNIHAVNGQFLPDNDPKPSNNNVFHGTHVAGCAAASLSNAVGIASPAGNCRIMPVKVGSDDPNVDGIFEGYKGILYAAKNGADIINCSWGGRGFSPFEYDIIRQATALGSLVVAAAGNNAEDHWIYPHYPGAFSEVLTVGSNAGAAKSGFSDYGPNVDVYCPGEAILSTMPGGGYSAQYGTSMASPIVAGVAALVKSIHPDWTPRQIEKQIKITSDNIFGQANDVARASLYGRINAYRAVRYNNPDFVGDAMPGVALIASHLGPVDTLKSDAPVRLELTFKNLLSAGKRFAASIQFVDAGFLAADSAKFYLGDLAAGEERTVACDIRPEALNPWFGGDCNTLIKIDNGINFTDFEALRLPVDLPTNNKFGVVYSGFKHSWLDMHSFAPMGSWFTGVGRYPYNGYYIYKHYNGLNGQPVNFKPTCVFAVDSKIAYFGSETTANGNTLVYIMEPTGMRSSSVASVTNFVNSIYFFDRAHGLLTGDPLKGAWGLATTADSGRTWQKALSAPTPASGETAYMNAESRVGDDYWVGTSLGNVLVTRDRGLNWSLAGTIKTQDAAACEIKQIAFESESDGVAFFTLKGKNDGITRVAATNDGGKTWQIKPFTFTTQGAPVMLFAHPDYKGYYALTAWSQIWTSKDGGSSWTPVQNYKLEPSQIGSPFILNGKLKIWQMGDYQSYAEINAEPKNIVKYLKLNTNSEYNFGEVALKSTKRSTLFTLENKGNYRVIIDSIAVESMQGATPGEFFLSDASSGLEIAGGTKGYYSFEFAPQSEGEKLARARFISDSDSGEVVVTLRGFGGKKTSAGEPLAGAISISPNPASSQATLLLASQEASKAEISVISAAGETVYAKIFPVSEGESSLPIDVSALPQGAYLVKVRAGERESVLKLSVVK